ncbi:sugar transport protein 13 [Tanacetum coccineum]|uniref:Sugar transport protein 13 n=1 Tax=Tanacetum coccineum TaxID=301880 RepID=A0ABQ5G1S2_9ASTR
MLGPAFRLLKGTRSNYAELEYDFEECYKALSEKLDWENPEGGDYPFDLTKPLPLVMSRIRQKVLVDYFFNNDLKYLKGGNSTMTYTTSLTKIKAAQYDLPGIKDMVLNIWVPVKVKVMRKHGYGYLKEIVNRLTNLSGDDVSDFAIALRMFTRSLVIQKRVEDLQLGVKRIEKTDTLKSVLKSSSETMDIASKVKNIEGKIRMPMRNVTFVRPLNDVTKKQVNPDGDIRGSIMTSECTPFLPAKDHSGSFADILQRKGGKRVVKVKELRNNEHVDGLLLRFQWKQSKKLVLDLKKEEIKLAPLWVKLHHVPIVAYSEVGLSLIATQLGRPIMMDSYTSNMCVSSWGRSTYARILIEISAEKELLESMVIAIPMSNGKGHSLATVEIEYEWKPPRCSTCVIFDHVIEKCPKNPIVEVEPKVNDEDGFVEVKRKKHKAKQNSKAKHIDGLHLNKPSVNFYYRKVKKGENSKTSTNDNSKPKEQVSRENVRVGMSASRVVPNVMAASSQVEVKNSFSSLGDEDTDWEVEGSKLNVINESDSEDIDELIMEGPNANNTLIDPITGASTPASNENNLSVCAILESHVSDSNLLTICPRVFRHWSWISNASCCVKGTRIILGWNHNDVDIMVINQDDQTIHVRVWLKLDRKELFCSFVYAHNRYIQRRALWNSLGLHKHYVRDRPWCILGDFNAALFLHDSSAGNSNIDISMREFKECVEDIEVMDVQNSGLQFTWSQKPKGSSGLLKKIDRIMANLKFNDIFAGAHAIFKPYRISDHAPSILNIPTVTKPKPKPFKFYNIITSHEYFKQVVLEGWSKQVSGFHMFRVAQKLKNLKKPLRKLLYEKGNLHNNVNKLRDDLDCVQTRLDNDPFNEAIRQEEATVLAAFNDACLMEERFLKKKSKIDWLREGESNSAYFHKACKSRVSRSRIDVVTNGDGVVFKNDKVADVFVSHYEAFLGQPGYTHGFNDIDLFRVKLYENVALDMTRAITTQEVKSVLFSTELNHTIIALILKVKSPTHVNDYRPISCCNVMFKCISKIIANRIKESLKDLVSPNQSAFVPGRSIADNVLLTHELMHNYHLDRGLPRCAFKVDIQKAYDTVNWDFLRKVLIGFGFHSRMIGWIMECVTATSFSISINGSLHGLFKGKHGLWQGDPLSPYLFTLIMEILTLMLQRDDLFLFANGDVDSVRVIKDALFEFKKASGLVPSLPKSTAYFCNVLNCTKSVILQILPFEEGRLPVKYLGVPLVSSRLIFRDCKELVKKVQARVMMKNRNQCRQRVSTTNSDSMIQVKGRNFWDIPLRGKMSWGWREILQLRPSIRDYMWYKLAGLSKSSKVRDALYNGAWEWPIYLLDKYPMLISVSLQNIDATVPDQLQ